MTDTSIEKATRNYLAAAYVLNSKVQALDAALVLGQGIEKAREEAVAAWEAVLDHKISIFVNTK